MSSFKEHIKNNKKMYKIISGITMAVLVGSTWIWLATRDNSYALSVDGKVIAVVKEKEEAQAAYESMVKALKKEKGVDIAINETLTIEPVHSKAKEINTPEELKKSLEDNLSYGIEAYEILVDGQSYAVVADQKSAVKILMGIAKQYLPESGDLTLDVKDISETSVDVLTENKEENKEAGTSESTMGSTSQKEEGPEVIEVADALPQEEVTTKVNVGSIEVPQESEDGEEEETEGQKIQRVIQGLDFNEEVTIRNTYVDTDEILSEEEADQTLRANKFHQIEYELKEGDNIWDIAVSHATTMERILELNPEIEDETRMQIGQVIKVEVPSPILSISTVEEATFKELIPGEIEYVEFSDLYEGETKVYQEGHDGLKELTVSVTKVNGVEVSRQLIAETVLKEPKIKVIAYGTKEKPKPKPTNSGSSSNSNSSSSGGSSSSSSNSSKKFIHPLKGAGRLSSAYGSRWGSFHRGVDYAAPAGTPIYASAAGEVIYSGYNNGGFGYLVIIDHGNGYQTYYAHCSKLYVRVGQKVSQGQNIAGVGSTGNSTGNHVHFEVRLNGTPVNPANYI